jgi:N-formylglutamate amidohydrolase
VPRLRDRRRDRCTHTVTTGLAQRLLDLTGEAPSVVIAEFDRDYIDANRSAACAFEPGQGADAQQFYDEYHNTIRQFMDDIRAENGGLGLLFDIHGTGGIEGDPGRVLPGDGAGLTMKRLVRADPQALQPRRSLRGFVEAANYAVVSEAPQLVGGYTGRPSDLGCWVGEPSRCRARREIASGRA